MLSISVFLPLVSALICAPAILNHSKSSVTRSAIAILSCALKAAMNCSTVLTLVLGGSPLCTKVVNTTKSAIAITLQPVMNSPIMHNIYYVSVIITQSFHFFAGRITSIGIFQARVFPITQPYNKVTIR